MKRMIFLLLLTFILASPQTIQAKEPLQEVTIAQFGKEKFLLYLPLYIADEQGFFARNGIKMNYIFAGNDDQIFATVISGDADFGMGDPIFTAIAAEKGLQAKTIAMMLNNLGLSGYTRTQSIPMIDTVDKLSGLRVGSFPEPSTTYTLLKDLQSKNPALKTMKIVTGAIGTQLAMLEADQLDIAIDLEPAVSLAESKGYRVVFPMGKFITPQVITGLMATQKMLDKNPQLAQKMVTSLQQAMDALHKDRVIAYDTAEKLFPNLGQKVIHRAVDRMLDQGIYPKSVIVDDKLWQRTLQTRIDNGDLKKPQPTAMAVDNQFALQARQ